MKTTTTTKTTTKTKEAADFYRSQSQSSEHDRRFFCTIIFVYTLIEVANNIYDNFVHLDFLSTSSQVLRTVFTVLFYLLFNIVVFVYFTFRKKGFQRRTHVLETIMVLILGLWILSRYILSIADAHEDPDGSATEEILLRFYVMTSDSLLWFILVASFIQQIYNTILLIILMLSGHIAMLFYGQQWFLASKVIAEVILIIILFTYMQKKRMKFIREAWRLSISDVFYKNVLNLLPEGVMVLSPNQEVNYVNHYFEHALAWNLLKSNLGTFSSSFQSLKLRHFVKETRFQQYVFPPACAKKMCMTKSKELTRTTSIDNDKEGLLKSKVCNVSTFMDLVEFFQQNTEIWASISTHTFVFDSKYIHPDSKEILSIEIKAFILHGEKDIQLTLLFRDTTDRDKVATLEAETESYKNNLIASFSHELRTPLNSNLGSLEQTIKHPHVPQDVKDTLVEPALISAKLLLHLVNDTLDYSQTLKGNLQVNIKPFSIANTIKECISLFEKRISAKGLGFEVFIERSCVLLWTDHQRLSQILTNLLSNALKFTFEGMIQVKFNKAADGCYKLSVIDTGTGMDQEAQERLRKNLVMDSVFESKVSADSAGIGLGLLMTSTLCYLLSPDEKPGLNFVSAKDEGSEFYVFLKDFSPGTETEITDQLASRRTSEYQRMLQIHSPTLSDISEDDMTTQKTDIVSHKTLTFKNKLTEDVKEEKAKDSPLILSPKKSENPVMVVDDEVFNLLILENYCKSSGLKTERAFNGKDAIEKIKKISAQGQKVELVLMDVNMPIMDGYETTRTLREMIKKKEVGDLVIIGVTAYVAKEKIDKCYEAGMTEVLNKPISHDDFVKIIKKYGFHSY